MLTYDDDLTTSNNAVSYIVMGVPYIGSFSYDNVNDGGAGGWGCVTCGLWPIAIPLITVSAVDFTAVPPTFDLTWADAQNSYGIAPHDDFLWGYQIVYNMTGYTFPVTYPVANTGWTPIGAPVQYGTGMPVQVAVDPGVDTAIFFALEIIGAGMNGAVYEAAPFSGTFSGQASAGIALSSAAIDLLSFSVDSVNNNAVVTWETGSEVDTAGFNIYRNTGNDLSVKVNTALIPSQGGPGSGAVYELVDTGVKAGGKYFYTLEEVETNNNKNQFGPLGITITPELSPRLSK
jgi:hypothetical protein